MSMDIAGEIGGKYCLVTAASRKLGAEIARRFASYGAHIGINYYQSWEAAEELKDELRALGVNAIALKADISDPQQAAKLLQETEEHLGKVDILVNNAGCFANAPYLELPLKDFDEVMDGNVRATYVLSQLAGRQMKKRGSGTIINIAATSAYMHDSSVYSLAKAGVVNLTEALAIELAPEVGVFGIAPDLIADNEENPADWVANILKTTPMKRLVTRSEIAEMACLMATPVFQMATGRTIIMDGGHILNR